MLAVTTPLLTVTLELLADQVTFWLVALDGEIVYDNVAVPPTVIDNVDCDKDIPVTLTVVSPPPLAPWLFSSVAILCSNAST